MKILKVTFAVHLQQYWVEFLENNFQKLYRVQASLPLGEKDFAPDALYDQIAEYLVNS